jgi:hypothetical protein
VGTGLGDNINSSLQNNRVEVGKDHVGTFKIYHNNIIIYNEPGIGTYAKRGNKLVWSFNRSCEASLFIPKVIENKYFISECNIDVGGSFDLMDIESGKIINSFDGPLLAEERGFLYFSNGYSKYIMDPETLDMKRQTFPFWSINIIKIERSEIKTSKGKIIFQIIPGNYDHQCAVNSLNLDGSPLNFSKYFKGVLSFKAKDKQCDYVLKFSLSGKIVFQGTVK